MSKLDCAHRPPCPGCPRFGVPGIAPAARAALDGLAARAGLPALGIFEGPRFGYRHRVRLAVRGRASNPKIGIFEEGTHRVVHIPNCSVHHPLVNDVVDGVRRVLVRRRVAPYSDAAHLGSVRAVQVVVERATQRAQVVVVTRESSPDESAPLFEELTRALGERVQGLFWNGNPERTNTILGRQFHKWAGRDTVTERFGGTLVHYPPGAFGQSNLPLFDELAARVRAFVPDGSRVLELYAGTGALGLPLAARSRHLELNELGDHSLWGLELGMAELDPGVRARVHVHASSAGTAAHHVADAEVVIVDPPRKGLDRALLEALRAAPPHRLIYVSCGLPALLSEAAELLDTGRVALTSLDAFGLFPFTEHVETLAVFDRRT